MRPSIWWRGRLLYWYVDRGKLRSEGVALGSLRILPRRGDMKGCKMSRRVDSLCMNDGQYSAPEPIMIARLATRRVHTCSASNLAFNLCIDTHTSKFTDTPPSASNAGSTGGALRAGSIGISPLLLNGVLWSPCDCSRLKLVVSEKERPAIRPETHSQTVGTVDRASSKGVISRQRRRAEMGLELPDVKRDHYLIRMVWGDRHKSNSDST